MDRPSPLALAAIALVALGVAHLRFHSGYTLDDAYITFRYARNLVRGAGLVYNPGDYVKGYSNTLFTFLMALPEAFRHDPIGFSRIIGLASFVALCAVAYGAYAHAAPSVRRDRGCWLLALLAGNTAIAVHFSGGLETGLYTAVVFAAVVQRVREQETGGRPWSALLFCLVVWSRPEGVLVFAAGALHDLGWRAVSRQFRRADLIFFLAPPLAYLGELAASLAYYGQAFPQTYYAKTRATAGLVDAIRTLWNGFRAQLAPESYLSRGLADAGFGWIGLCLSLVALLDPAIRRRSAALLLALAAQLVFIVRAGDDWAPAFRFGVPLLPLGFALLIDALGTIARLARGYERLCFHVLGACALALCLPIQLRESQRIASERPVNAENKLAQGEWFATLAEPGITLASFDIGGQGYAAGGFELLDSVGLTVRETTGCRDKMLPRCTQYARLVLPELVRLHNNRRRDAFVSRSVVAEAPYVALDGGKYLLARELVSPALLPATARPSAQAWTSGAVLVGHDAPVAVAPTRTLQLTLFWRRASLAREVLANRTLRWHSTRGDRSAEASESVLRHLAAAEPKDDALFADLVTLRTPSEPGHYELQVVAGDRALTLDAVDCLNQPDATEAASSWLARAGTLSPPASLQLLKRAAELSEAAIQPYQRAAVELAGSQRREAERLSNSRQALRLAQSAKRELLRAFWTTGSALPELRREIDANAAFRRRLIHADLARFAGGP
jgi:arabinofuranosyltransferase